MGKGKKLRLELITDEFLISVAQKSLINAGDLIDDADLLFQNSRLPRAYTLYQLATEELGKAVFSFVLLIPIRGEDKKKKYIREFFDHPGKTSRSRSMDFFLFTILKEKDPEKAKDFFQKSLSENSYELNELKNYSLYTSEINGEVLLPKEIITNERVYYVQFRAKTRQNAAKAFIESGLQNLDLLKKHAKDYIPNFEQEIKTLLDEIDNK